MKIFLSILLLSFASLSARSVEELSWSYQKKLIEIQTGKTESLAKLNNGYLKRLKTIGKAIQRSGKLEAVEKIEHEVGQIEGNIWPLKSLETAAPAPLKKARKLYTSARISVERKSAAAQVSLADTMLKLLKKQKISATQSGELKEAKEARALIQKLTEDENLKSARILANSKKSDSEFLPALRLRRFGDELEVLVGYDATGKISLNSPVQDVIEITGGKRDKGKSGAQNLGQFVGAKGFSPQSFVSYHKTFTKSTDMADFSVAGFRNDGIKAHGDEKGFTLTLTPQSKNSNIAIANLLPPKKVAGHFRVTCRYYLPNSNRNLLGFSAYQGFGQPIERHIFKTKGKWVTKTLESDSLNELHHFRIYPSLRESKTWADAAGERIVIGALTIEQLSFSAFICERFDEAGDSLSIWALPADQKLIVNNGTLLSN